ncbi:two-component sensor CbrA [Thioalkalivibrio sulfidiphilus HL-EbGr7]|uniref:histidine kinase n=1 Tax=Thioalkalivibrio sulfidiphilus (strain HL-EbGR7) TaxID=396588 RepID=B8GP27_THISH|nr:sensor histidine kinase [Thioalkalivibrio sulfidiphilus]ACL72116.1 two-component sensor CbrA [Thioalkalivibrio sulfidiphilus HL-EbGr7]
MNAELGILYAVGVAYLALLFFVAHATEKGWLPDALVRHPLVYALSLGVYATSWSFYGSVGFAGEQGYNFLTIYLGVTLAFALAPVLLAPILRLVRDYQLTSLADLFAFRYRHQFTGVLVTLFMLAGVLPYIALQIKAVTESVAVLTQEAPPHLLALGFCATLSLFAILFGARHITPREKHEGLVMAIAFESAVKLIALLMVGVFALFGILGGPAALGEWLLEHPEAIEALYAPVREGPWMTFMLLAFAAAFLLPRQFHMIFVENMEPGALRVAAWAFPLFLLLLNLPIPLILWAGQQAQVGTVPDYYVLGLSVEHGYGWALFTFIGGVSAASAMMIVTTLALAAMCLNHLILPARYQNQALPRQNLYTWLLWGRRILIVLIIALGYVFYRLMEFHQSLAQIGLISFVAVAQFLPGLMGLLFWPRATRWGFIAGLAGGITVWALALIVPLLQQSGLMPGQLELQTWFRATEQNHWAFATFWSLALNAVLFVAGSLLTRPSPEETEAALACRREQMEPPRGQLEVRSVQHFEEQLAQTVGPQTAALEVSRALADLGLKSDETHPGELRRLRERLERNLSGLMGPLLSRMIVDHRLRVDPHTQMALADSLRFVEEQLEHSNVRLQGLAAELDTLRRYHRQVLHELPLGVCSLTPGGEIIIWNSAMGLISGIPSRDAVGQELRLLGDPWHGILRGFLQGDDKHLYKLQINLQGRSRWINLHKSEIEAPGALNPGAVVGGTVILVEDLTELHTLESEVAHNNRLASIGRLAAGVAHEIGNPLTGIASLAQNLHYEPDESERELSAQQILEQTRRINNIVQSLITFSHTGEVPSTAMGAVDIKICVDEAMQLVQLSDTARAHLFENRLPPGITVRGSHQKLLQVFVNLINNAMQASGPGDRIRIQGEATAGFAEILVEDEGTGIPETLLDRVFEPFFTTKPPGEGTGLGLSVVYSIIQDHGGAVYVDNLPQGGACFTLRLPLSTTPRLRASG